MVVCGYTWRREIVSNTYLKIVRERGNVNVCLGEWELPILCVWERDNEPPVVTALNYKSQFFASISKNVKTKKCFVACTKKTFDQLLLFYKVLFLTPDLVVELFQTTKIVGKCRN